MNLSDFCLDESFPLNNGSFFAEAETGINQDFVGLQDQAVSTP
jgi:hypothetical protein|tara:strand:+ start:674 stop:802 length:129 start_codon:yes stop_codon:yes gene_type:complete